MSALAAAQGIQLEGRQLALLCQKVENHVVGGWHPILACASWRWNSAASDSLASWLCLLGVGCTAPCEAVSAGGEAGARPWLLPTCCRGQAL
jgi:hypothetical protein